MRRRPSLFLILLTAAASALVSSPAPAQAAPAPVKMTFDAAPEPVAKGRTVSLTGRVWVGATGNRGRVSFYFRENGAYVYKGFTTTTDAGNFRRSYTATTTGAWKAVYAGTTTRRNAARLDAVQVVQTRSKLIASYPLTTGDWQGTRLRIPTQNYTAIVTYKCADSGFLYLYWHSSPDVMEEYRSSSKAADTVRLNGHAGGRTGFFKISTWVDCSWTLKVFAGVQTVQV